MLQNHGRTFTRSQATAVLASAVDFGTMVVLVELLGLYYVPAVALGAAAGGVTNFTANRKWAFGSNGRVRTEAQRYLLVSAASMGWNVLLTWGLTELLGLQYMLSRISASVLVGFLWNYPLHKYWVFLVHRGSLDGAEFNALMGAPVSGGSPRRGENA